MSEVHDWPCCCGRSYVSHASHDLATLVFCREYRPAPQRDVPSPPSLVRLGTDRGEGLFAMNIQIIPWHEDAEIACTTRPAMRDGKWSTLRYGQVFSAHVKGTPAEVAAKLGLEVRGE